MSSSGWTKQGIARLWFEKSSLADIGDERPQVLILDGLNSHNIVELLKGAMANQIEIVELPAHTSNWLQPCDHTVFKPFKDAYNGMPGPNAYLSRHHEWPCQLLWIVGKSMEQGCYS